MELYYRLIFLIGVILILYFIYRIIRLLLISKADTYLVKENGKTRREGMIRYVISKDRYIAYDLTKPFADRQTGEVQVIEGKAWVRICKENKGHIESGYEDIGYVDLNGNIYDKNHSHAGYIGNTAGQPDISGKRKWYELFLRCHAYVFSGDRCVGKCIETGRFGKPGFSNYTVLARAAAFLLLYQKEQRPVARSEGVSVYYNQWSNTALLSTFIFCFVYAFFYIFNIQPVQMPFLGDFGFMFTTMALFLCIWGVIRQVVIEQSLAGKPVEHFLMLLNRNTGVSGINNLILLFAAVGLIVSFTLFGRDFAPVQLAVLIGVGVNAKFVTKEPWTVVEKFRPLPPDDLEEEDTANKISRRYSWELDSDESLLTGELELFFTQEEIDELRQRNPFRTEASLDFNRNIELLFKEKTDNSHLKRINHYILKAAYEATISELDTMQFILDFVQEPNISYIADEESPETGGVEYARFPVETLFDKRGDCDCKAVLAAALFRNAGYKVAYITSHDHAAVAVACPKKWFGGYRMDKLYGAEKQAFFDKDGTLYYFCETTGDSFRVGDYSKNISPDDFKNIRFLR
jgi:hypothetical protein